MYQFIFDSIDRNIDVEWQLPDILEYFRTVFLADAEYRQVKKDMQEYLIAKQTVEHILGIDRQKREEEKKQQKVEQR